MSSLKGDVMELKGDAQKSLGAYLIRLGVAKKHTSKSQKPGADKKKISNDIPTRRR